MQTYTNDYALYFLAGKAKQKKAEGKGNAAAKYLKLHSLILQLACVSEPLRCETLASMIPNQPGFRYSGKNILYIALHSTHTYIYIQLLSSIRFAFDFRLALL
mmetsp:Transcript_10499/g.15775  ORF Transcript_10499/g.15775 Transcript_10499/m.15775 type:complete len:103 (+) Transcript_10499:134-442(+)